MTVANNDTASLVTAINSKSSEIDVTASVSGMEQSC